MRTKSLTGDLVSFALACDSWADRGIEADLYGAVFNADAVDGQVFYPRPFQACALEEVEDGVVNRAVDLVVLHESEVELEIAMGAAIAEGVELPIPEDHADFIVVDEVATDLALTEVADGPDCDVLSHS